VQILTLFWSKEVKSHVVLLLELCILNAAVWAQSLQIHMHNSRVDEVRWDDYVRLSHVR